jgi:hypothetical protein
MAKWAQEDVKTSHSLLNNNTHTHSLRLESRYALKKILEVMSTSAYTGLNLN